MGDPSEFEAKIYDHLWGRSDYTAEVAFLAHLFQEQGIQRVLDCACGTGGYVLALTPKGFDVRGLDPRASMVELAHFKQGAEAIEFKVGSMASIPNLFPRGFDAAICMDGLSSLVDDEAIMAALGGVNAGLRAQGLFVATARNIKRLGDDHLGLTLGEHLEEDGLEILEIDHYARESPKTGVILWRPIWLIKQKGKASWQLQEHRLRWFRNDEVAHLLNRGGFEVLACYGDTEGKQLFLADKHERMMFVCRKREELPPPPPAEPAT